APPSAPSSSIAPMEVTAAVPVVLTLPSVTLPEVVAEDDTFQPVPGSALVSPLVPPVAFRVIVPLPVVADATARPPAVSLNPITPVPLTLAQVRVARASSRVPAAPTPVANLSLHDALPISAPPSAPSSSIAPAEVTAAVPVVLTLPSVTLPEV